MLTIMFLALSFHPTRLPALRAHLRVLPAVRDAAGRLAAQERVGGRLPSEGLLLPAIPGTYDPHDSTTSSLGPPRDTHGMIQAVLYLV
jgi:hypothetical protein